MKKTLLFILILYIFTLPAYANRIIELSYSNWSPYLDPQLHNKGFLADRVRKALQSQGYEVHFLYFDDWVKAYRAAIKGRVDGTLAWNCNYVRSTQFYFSYPITHSKQVLFHLKKNPLEWKTTRDLAQFGKMGVTVGYHYGHQYQQGLRNGDFQIMMNPNDSANFQQLLQGNIGTFLMDEEVGKRLLKTQFAREQNRITYSKHAMDQIWLFVLINRHKPDGLAVKKALNLGIQELVGMHAMEKVPFEEKCEY